LSRFAKIHVPIFKICESTPAPLPTNYTLFDRKVCPPVLSSNFEICIKRYRVIFDNLRVHTLSKFVMKHHYHTYHHEENWNLNLSIVFVIFLWSYVFARIWQYYTECMWKKLQQILHTWKEKTAAGVPNTEIVFMDSITAAMSCRIGVADPRRITGRPTVTGTLWRQR